MHRDPKKNNPVSSSCTTNTVLASPWETTYSLKKGNPYEQTQNVLPWQQLCGRLPFFGFPSCARLKKHGP
jgi:hypothetical protein